MIPSSISNYLERNHARYSVMSHPVAYTAQEVAAAAHVPGGEWAKAVVCFADDLPILAVLPASAVVNLNQLRRVAHAHSVRLAKESEFVQLYQDCEPGAVPPLGPLYGQRVFVDQSLAADPEVVFSAGSHHDAIRMPYREFERLAQATVGEFASGSAVTSPARTPMVTDPVCGATFEEHEAAGKSVLDGQTYYFCSRSCEMAFDDNPYGYARNVT